MRADGPIGQPGNLTIANTYTREVMSGFYNDTAGITTAEGAAMTLAFEGRRRLEAEGRELMAGSGVYVYGLSGPEGGEAEVSLDGVMMSRLNMTVRRHDLREVSLMPEPVDGLLVVAVLRDRSRVDAA